MGWGALKMSVELDDKKLSSQMMTLENQISKTANKSQELKNKLDAMANTKIPTAEYIAIQKQIDEAEKKLNKMNEAMEKNEAIGKKLSNTSLAKMRYEMEETKSTIEYATAEMQDLVDSGKAFTLGSDSAQYLNISSEITETDKKMKILSKRHDELIAKQEKAGKAGKKSFTIFGETLDKVIKRITKLALRIFIFSQITKAFRTMISAMKEGLQSLAQFSSVYNANMSDFTSRTTELKNNLASMAEPILNIIIPALTSLVSWLNTAVEAITKFLSALSGKSTYTKAKKQLVDYAKSVEKAGKDAKNALASFDDLNVLQQDSSSNTSGEITGADAFEEMEIDSDFIEKVNEIKELLVQMIPLATILGGLFLGWKVGNVILDLFKLSPLLGTVVGFLTVIVGLAVAVYNGFKMWNNGVEWKNIVGYVAGIALAVGALLALFGPVVAGIALIIGSVAGIILALKDISENGFTAKNVTLLVVSAFGLLLGVFMALGAPAAAIVAVIILIVGALAKLVSMGGNGEEALGHLKDAFKALGDFVSKVFKGDMEGAFESLKKAGKDFGNFFISVAEGIANGFIKMVNHIIDAINSLSFGPIADWVPVIGGKEFSLNIPNWTSHVNLPRLANGGVTTGSTLANIGEAGREAVLPLENNTGWMEDLASKMVEYMSTSSRSQTVIMELDGKEFARTSLPFINAENSRIGVSLAKG